MPLLIWRWKTDGHMAHEAFQQTATGAPQAWDKKRLKKKCFIKCT